MLFAFLLISMSLLPWAPVTYAAGFKVLADSSGIRIISEEPVYSFDNMAPGDSADINLEVENESKESYSLAISADVEEGSSEPLYETLSIAIIGEEEKYSGPLSGLQKIDLGSFAAESTRNLSMTLTLPTDAGNELQGLSVKIIFHLYQVEDSEPPGPGVDDPPGPDEPPGPGGDDPSGPDEPPGPGGDDPPGPDEPPGPGGDDPGQSTEPKEDPSGETELPVTGTKIDLLLPIGLILFLIGLLILGSAKKEQTE